ncbi:MAG TPA: hypothetical protein VFW00_01310 [Rhodocyclaceae bacterium]|nr:hypothetical protein [Rhodocyclaceae bacterium]
MNEPAFEFVRANEMFNIEGLISLYNKFAHSPGGFSIQFPKGAKEIKADWDEAPADISPQKLSHFHWRRVNGKIFLLTGFHIMTKDLPNWFWADFEHVDYDTQDATLDPRIDPAMDRTTRNQFGSGAPDRGSVDGERRELSNTKWADYRLRGTQIAFVDAEGTPTRLGNTRIESGFVHYSSCMTCHARATVSAHTIGSGSDAHIVHLSPNSVHSDTQDITDDDDSDIGVPLPFLFSPDGQRTFAQTDFFWSASFRAAHKK